MVTGLAQSLTLAKACHNPATGIYYGVLKQSSALEARVYCSVETQDQSSLSGERNRCKYRVTGTEWRETKGDSILNTNEDYQVWRCGGVEMS